MLPPTVDILVEQHFLRKKYTDPITGKDFDLVYSSQGAAQTPGQTPGQARPGPRLLERKARPARLVSAGRSGGSRRRRSPRRRFRRPPPPAGAAASWASSARARRSQSVLSTDAAITTRSPSCSPRFLRRPAPQTLQIRAAMETRQAALGGEFERPRDEPGECADGFGSTAGRRIQRADVQHAAIRQRQSIASEPAAAIPERAAGPAVATSACPRSRHRPHSSDSAS